MCLYAILYMAGGNGYLIYQCNYMKEPIDLTVLIWLSIASYFVDVSPIGIYVINLIKNFDVNNFLTRKSIELIKTGMLLILMSAAISYRYAFLSKCGVDFTNSTLVENCYKLVFYVPVEEVHKIQQEVIESTNNSKDTAITKEDQKK